MKLFASGWNLKGTNLVFFPQLNKGAFVKQFWSDTLAKIDWCEVKWKRMLKKWKSKLNSIERKMFTKQPEPKFYKFTFLICTPIPEGIPGLVLPRLVVQAALRRSYAFKIFKILSNAIYIIHFYITTILQCWRGSLNQLLNFFIFFNNDWSNS